MKGIETKARGLQPRQSNREATTAPQ